MSKNKPLEAAELAAIDERHNLRLCLADLLRTSRGVVACDLMAGEVRFVSAKGRQWRARWIAGEVWALERMMRAGKRGEVQQWGWRGAGNTTELAKFISDINKG